MSRCCFRYSDLLRWAVLRKMAGGMSATAVELAYGIPTQTACCWRREAGL